MNHNAYRNNFYPDPKAIKIKKKLNYFSVIRDNEVPIRFCWKGYKNAMESFER